MHGQRDTKIIECEFVLQSLYTTTTQQNIRDIRVNFSGPLSNVYVQSYCNFLDCLCDQQFLAIIESAHILSSF